jgi:hypothetical protein
MAPRLSLQRHAVAATCLAFFGINAFSKWCIDKLLVGFSKPFVLPLRGGLVLLARVASSCLWDLAGALADYFEAAVYRDYRLFNRRREVSFRKKLCRVTGHREVVFN